MSRAFQFILCFVACVGAGPAFSSNPAAQAEAQSRPEPIVMAPYRADYTLRLRHNADPDNEVAALKGLLEVRMEQSCDGWHMQQSLGFHMYTQDGSALEHLAHLSSFEEPGGNSFIFNAQTWEDRQLVEQVAGIAGRAVSAVQGKSSVRFSKPEELTQELPAQVVFPGEHVRQIVIAALAGQRNAMHTVFDGSSTDNPFQISSWIGESSAERVDVSGLLAGHTSWPVRLAYFAMQAREPLPQFEMSALLYDNGVVGDMIYDYGQFEINVTLKNLQLLAVPDCSQR